MAIEEIYQKFIQKVNKNAINDNIAVDRGRFVFIFNEVQNKYLEWILDKRNEDEIRYVQKFLISDLPLDFKSKVINHQDFKLPEDYFDFSNVQAFASSGSCKNKKLFLFEVKSEDLEEYLRDEFNKPSFKFRESFYLISSDTLNIYVEDFSIDKVYLTYYRYPRQIDIKGYITIDNKQSVDIDPEWDAKSVDRILSACAKEFDMNNEDFDKFQLDSQRIFNKI